MGQRTFPTEWDGIGAEGHSLIQVSLEMGLQAPVRLGGQALQSWDRMLCWEGAPLGLLLAFKSRLLHSLKWGEGAG